MAASISRDLKGRPWHLRERRDVDEVGAPEMVGELTTVQFGHDDSLVATKQVTEVGRQRAEVHDVRLGDLDARPAATLDGGVDRGPRRAPPEHQHVGVRVAFDLDGRDVLRDLVDLRLAQLRSSARGSPACSRCCRCRPSSRVRRLGASSPGVPGIAHGRARFSSRRYGQNSSSVRRRRRRPRGSVSVANGTEMSGSASTSGSFHGSEPLAR